jgi:hypothetical protein
VVLKTRLQWLSGLAAETLAVDAHLRGPAPIDHVPAGGWLDKALRDVVEERVTQPRGVPRRGDALPGGPGQSAGRAGPTPFWPLRQDDFVIHPDLNPGARCRHGPVHADNELTDSLRVDGRLPGGERPRSNAVRFSAHGHPRTDRLLARTVPGHCVSFRHGPAHRTRTSLTLQESRESEILVLFTGPSAGDTPAQSRQAQPPLTMITPHAPLTRDLPSRLAPGLAAPSLAPWDIRSYRGLGAEARGGMGPRRCWGVRCQGSYVVAAGTPSLEQSGSCRETRSA